MTYRSIYSPKDWQRAKVYAAENAAFLSDRPFFETREDVQVYVDKLIKSAWFQRRFKSTRSIEVRPNRGGSRAYGNHNGGAAYIKLPNSDWGRSMPVVLHEIGHAVTPRYNGGILIPWHGREFCRNVLELVHHCMGKESADRLKAEYKKLKVQWREKRKMSPETVAANAGTRTRTGRRTSRPDSHTGRTGQNVAGTKCGINCEIVVDKYSVVLYTVFSGNDHGIYLETEKTEMEMTNPKWNELLTRAVNEPGVVLAAYTAFHNYSIGNQIAAMCQCLDRGISPGPINTYKGWLGVGRQVQRGQKAMWLCMPMTFKDKTKLDENGEPRRGVFFQWKPFWFVMAQTEGEPVAMPELPEWSKDRAMASLNINEVPFEAANGNVMGYAKDRSVAISPLAPLPLKTLIHELAHVVLGHTDVNHSDTTTRNLREVEAESVAMIVLESLAQPGAEFCRGYIQGWLEGDVIPDASAAKIFGAADRILKSGYAVTGKTGDENAVE